MNDPRIDPISPEQRAEPVVVVAYDPAWPASFERVRAVVAAALGDLAVGIEHVGSTAVPGLEAKPIVDVDVVIRRTGDLDDVVRRLAEIGYTHLGDLGIVGREAFRATKELPRHHLYVCASGAPPLQAHLILRDALRDDPALAAQYGRLKRELAERYRDDRDAYAEGKSAFITAVLLRERDGRDKRALRHRRG
jgi:GrpB-like predicted nucleotidyltransferase (UPF0157 family)